MGFPSVTAFPLGTAIRRPMIGLARRASATRACGTMALMSTVASTSDLSSSPRRVVILGSTGSIGTQAIDVISRNPERFQVVALAAGGKNAALLARQALDLGVEAVAVAKATAAQDLQLAFYAEAQQRGYSTGDFKL